MPYIYDEESQCAICQSAFGCDFNEIVTTNCSGKHIFHADCLAETHKRRLICPTCNTTLQHVGHAYEVLDVANCIFAGALTKLRLFSDYRIALQRVNATELDVETLLNCILFNKAHDWADVYERLGVRHALGQHSAIGDTLLAMFRYCLIMSFQTTQFKDKRYLDDINQQVIAVFKKNSTQPGRLMHSLQSNLLPIYAALGRLDNSPLKKVLEAIESHDPAQAEDWFRSLLDGHPELTNYLHLTSSIFSGDTAYTTIDIEALTIDSGSMSFIQRFQQYIERQSTSTWHGRMLQNRVTKWILILLTIILIPMLFLIAQHYTGFNSTHLFWLTRNFTWPEILSNIDLAEIGRIFLNNISEAHNGSGVIAGTMIAGGLLGFYTLTGLLIVLMAFLIAGLDFLAMVNGGGAIALYSYGIAAVILWLLDKFFRFITRNRPTDFHSVFDQMTNI